MDSELNELDNASVVFHSRDKKLLTLDDTGIKFHFENFDGWTPDDFAKEFLHILTCHFNCKFEKKDDKDGDDYQSPGPISSTKVRLVPADKFNTVPQFLEKKDWMEKRILTLESQVRLLDDALAEVKARIKHLVKPDERTRYLD